MKGEGALKDQPTASRILVILSTVQCDPQTFRKVLEKFDIVRLDVLWKLVGGKFYINSTQKQNP